MSRDFPLAHTLKNASSITGRCAPGRELIALAIKARVSPT
jgi:hypothetical protein